MKPYRVKQKLTFDHCSVTTGHVLIIFELLVRWTTGTSPYLKFVTVAQTHQWLNTYGGATGQSISTSHRVVARLSSFTYQDRKLDI